MERALCRYFRKVWGEDTAPVDWSHAFEGKDDGVYEGVCCIAWAGDGITDATIAAGFQFVVVAYGGNDAEHRGL